MLLGDNIKLKIILGVFFIFSTLFARVVLVTDIENNALILAPVYQNAYMLESFKYYQLGSDSYYNINYKDNRINLDVEFGSILTKQTIGGGLYAKEASYKDGNVLKYGFDFFGIKNNRIESSLLKNNILYKLVFLDVYEVAYIVNNNVLFNINNLPKSESFMMFGIRKMKVLDNELSVYFAFNKINADSNYVGQEVTGLAISTVGKIKIEKFKLSYETAYYQWSKYLNMSSVQNTYYFHKTPAQSCITNLKYLNKGNSLYVKMEGEYEISKELSLFSDMELLFNATPLTLYDAGFKYKAELSKVPVVFSVSYSNYATSYFNEEVSTGIKYKVYSVVSFL
ncbi:MAG: hypothetical protein A2Y40_01315 [Candidatus Margulisbacteria bacterium GWF2_35_9]|nr:MAG: hypothetical protein A2Y40_01315 [Candidatus Margulisbacteria bacterium GWF2_35_9]